MTACRPVEILLRVMHALAYYGAWIAVIYYVRSDLFLLAALIGFGVTLLQYGCVCLLGRYADNPPWQFMFWLTLLGAGVDSLLSASQVFVFKVAVFNGWCAPLWMMGLWCNFSFNLWWGLRQYFNRSWFFAITALTGFPAAYASGHYLAVVQYPYGLGSVCVIGVIWSILLPLRVRSFYQEGEAC